LWSDLRHPERCCALLPRQRNHYDLLFDISKPSRAGTPAPKPRSPSPEWPPTTYPTGAMPQRSHTSPGRSPSRNHPSNNSKHITPSFQTGSLQVALSKTVRRPASRLASWRIPPDRFRYSPRTYRPRAAV
jgi:hypothetical protein